MDDVLDRLTETLAERKDGDPESSYVASLHNKGLNKILEKVGEEATETIARISKMIYDFYTSND